jgi:hypothetical protein
MDAPPSGQQSRCKRRLVILSGNTTNHENTSYKASLPYMRYQDLILKA